MADLLYDNFEISYIYESGERYLALKPLQAEGTEIIKYQVEMLLHNPSRFIARVEPRITDGEAALYYDISSLTPLVDYISAESFTFGKLIDLMSNIIETFTLGRKLLLNEASFALKRKLIYINPSDCNPCLIYIPCNINGDCMADLKELIFDAVTKMEFESSGLNDHIISRVIKLVREPCTNLADFYKILNDLRPKNECNENEPLIIAKEKDSCKDIYNLPDTCNDVLHQDDEKIAKSRNSCLPETIMGFKASNVLHVLMFQTAVILIAVSAEIFLRNTLIQPYIRYGVIMTAVLFINIMLFVFLYKVGSKKDSEADMDEALPDSIIEPFRNSEQVKKEDTAYEKYSIEEASVNEHSTTSENQEMAESSYMCGDSKALSIQAKNPDKTVLLYDNKSMVAYLVREYEGIVQRYPISGETFIIGRNADLSDLIINERPVGRIHAEIRMCNRDYYLIDRNSKNGTSINGSKLESGKEYRLQNGDNIEFANVLYMFTA